jgi:hypothetical protein
MDSVGHTLTQNYRMTLMQSSWLAGLIFGIMVD